MRELGRLLGLASPEESFNTSCRHHSSRSARWAQSNNKLHACLPVALDLQRLSPFRSTHPRLIQKLFDLWYTTLCLVVREVRSPRRAIETTAKGSGREAEAVGVNVQLQHLARAWRMAQGELPRFAHVTPRCSKRRLKRSPRHPYRTRRPPYRAPRRAPACRP